MGLFGYGKGSYKRNGDRAVKRMVKLSESLPNGYERVRKHLTDAMWQVKKSYSSRADFKRIAAADERMFRYLCSTEKAVEDDERALAVAYSSLLPEVVRSRYFGEPEIRSRELELREELTIANGKRDSLLDGIDRVKRGRLSDAAREEYLAALEKKLSEISEKCERLGEELGTLNAASELAGFFDLKEALARGTEDAESVKTAPEDLAIKDFI